MKYHVEYHPDGWRRIAPQYPYAPSHDDFGAVQMVQQDIDDRTRLCAHCLTEDLTLSGLLPHE
jgi:hypothetical protein